MFALWTVLRPPLGYTIHQPSFIGQGQMSRTWSQSPHQLFFFFYVAPWRHVEDPGQGSDPTPNLGTCDLYCSCGKARSFNPLCQAGDRISSWCCRDAAGPSTSQWERLRALAVNHGCSEPSLPAAFASLLSMLICSLWGGVLCAGPVTWEQN